MKFIAKGNRQINFCLHDKGEKKDISITPGGDPIELPENNSYVKDLEFKGHIKKFTEAPVVSSKK